ncbi:hypothetical protein, partial [Klebsiella pneumoniae]
MDADGGLTPEIDQALIRLCAAEGVTPAQVQSIEVLNDEFCVRISRQGGGSRLVIYPLALL